MKCRERQRQRAQKATESEREQYAKISIHLLRKLGCAFFFSEICTLFLIKASLQPREILTLDKDDRV